jgi:hypothetical protein
MTIGQPSETAPMNLRMLERFNSGARRRKTWSVPD